MNRLRTLIMGAAGRDFHNFNTFFRDNPDYTVAAFTAAQIPTAARQDHSLDRPDQDTKGIATLPLKCRGPAPNAIQFNMTTSTRAAAPPK